MDHRIIHLLAHNVRSLWNVGSFFRTADAFSVTKIYLTGYTGHPPRKEITKTAIGAEECVSWEQTLDPLPVIASLKENGFQIVGLEQTPSSIPLCSFTPVDKLCLIVGHELDGVPDILLNECDKTVEIPMHGMKESLNVAVAAGIALNHIRHFTPQTQSNGSISTTASSRLRS
jgi:23S rRNA (guanosine2251-2'-O)-methyltransferase